MCASPLSPRHAQPDWMGGGLVSRQMMHAPPSGAIFVFSWWIGAGPPNGMSNNRPRGKWPATKVPSHRRY
jgi:hypothetical protein